MKLTEERKQIIEIIEPYMDKTLGDGCLVFVDNEYIGGYYTYINGNILKKGIGCKYRTDGDNCGSCDLEEYEVEILGHYDITAVMKYIDEIGCGHIFIKKEMLTDEILLFTEDTYEGKEVIEWGDNLGWLPCKPLHLYTHQEDKDLLELLKKLGN